MEDKASWGQTDKYGPVVDPALKVRCVVTFIDDLNLHAGYGVFLNVVDLGGLERKRERRVSPFLWEMRQERMGWT